MLLLIPSILVKDRKTEKRQLSAVCLLSVPSLQPPPSRTALSCLNSLRSARYHSKYKISPLPRFLPPPADPITPLAASSGAALQGYRKSSMPHRNTFSCCFSHPSTQLRLSRLLFNCREVLLHVSRAVEPLPEVVPIAGRDLRA